MSEKSKQTSDSSPVASRCSSSAFGVPEMRDFAKDHPDFRVRLMMRKLDEIRSRSARLSETLVRMRRELIELQEFAESHHSDEPGHVIFHGLTVDVPHRCELIRQ